MITHHAPSHPPAPFFITFERHVQKSKTKVKGKRNSKSGSKSLSAICANNKNDSTKCPVYAPSPSPLHSTLCPWEALTGMCVCVCSLCHMAIISAWPARTANELNQKSICRRDKSGGGEVSKRGSGRLLRIKWNLWDKILKKNRERNLCNFPYERELLIAPWQPEFVISSPLFLIPATHSHALTHIRIPYTYIFWLSSNLPRTVCANTKRTCQLSNADAEPLRKRNPYK